MAKSAAHASSILLLSLILMSGCVGGQPAGTRPSRSSSVITAAEIAEAQRTGVRDLYELIERLHPLWLQIRSERSLRLETVVLVYHNTNRLGGIDVLRGYPLTSITSVRYLDSAQAGLLPGAGSGGTHVEGAIVISTAIGDPNTK